jgi:hypothetical protein
VRRGRGLPDLSSVSKELSWDNKADRHISVLKILLMEFVARVHASLDSFVVPLPQDLERGRNSPECYRRLGELQGGIPRDPRKICAD